MGALNGSGSGMWYVLKNEVWECGKLMSENLTIEL